MMAARSALRGLVVSTTIEDPDANVASMRRLSSGRTCVAANRCRYKLVFPAPGSPIMMMHSSTVLMLCFALIGGPHDATLCDLARRRTPHRRRFRSRAERIRPGEGQSHHAGDAI